MSRRYINKISLIGFQKKSRRHFNDKKSIQDEKVTEENRQSSIGRNFAAINDVEARFLQFKSKINY